MSANEDHEWKFFRFGLLVTGKGEEEFLPNLFRSLTESGHCHLKVTGRFGQRSPITSEKRLLKMVGEGKTIPDKDAKEIGFPARRCLSDNDSFVMLLDDLEANRVSQAEAIYERYRNILDTMLPEPQQHRASVHFFVNMIEAYYFADAEAVNSVLGTDLEDYEGDVESIRHPKGDLKELYVGFDEIEHGKDIVVKLDVPHMLSRSETCAALRTLFGWCSKAIGDEPTERFQLRDGKYSDVTKKQIDDL